MQGATVYKKFLDLYNNASYSDLIYRDPTTGKKVFPSFLFKCCFVLSLLCCCLLLCSWCVCRCGSLSIPQPRCQVLTPPSSAKSKTTAARRTSPSFACTLVLSISLLFFRFSC